MAYPGQKSSPSGELSPQATERVVFYITICALLEPSVRSSWAR